MLPDGLGKTVSIGSPTQPPALREITARRVTRSYKEKANSNRPIGPYKAVRYLT